jgi:hypothetical protein
MKHKSGPVLSQNIVPSRVTLSAYTQEDLGAA